MKVDVAVAGPELRQISALARLAEDIGFDALYTAETRHDPFLPLASAAEHTGRIGLGTSIAAALTRSPLTLAHLANDLQEYSRGRFVLGLGSQDLAQVAGRPGEVGWPGQSRRFGAHFHPPIPRMREMVHALRAIWASWQEGQRPRFQSEIYGEALATPFFAPPPHPYGPPRIHLAGVGPRMTELAGEIADGLILHGFTTARHLREVTVPALERGLRRSGRAWEDIEVVAPAYIVTGSGDESYERAERQAREAIALHGSTPAYRRVLESAGHGDLQERLSALARQGRWAEMPGLIGDDLVGELTFRGDVKEIPERLVRRYGALCRRVTFMGPFHQDPGTWAALVSRIHDITFEPVPS